MKKYILITGGVGFVGSNLINYLLKKTKNNILSIDNYSTGTKKNEIINKRIKYFRGHTKDIDKILKGFESKIIVAFHFGEFARIHQSFNSLEECLESNLYGSSKVFSFCLKNNIKIIYSATSASLGNKGNDQNLSPYAFTKSKNIKLLINLNKWFGLKYEAIYFYNVYGPKHIRTGHMATVIGIFEDCFLKNRPLTVVKPGFQSRKFTHILDTVHGCFYAWKKNLNRHYSISNNQSFTILQIAKMFKRKIRLLPKRKGERFKSTQAFKIGDIKIYPIICKIKIKDYINKFIKMNTKGI